jgi:hypothetical protein
MKRTTMRARAEAIINSPDAYDPDTRTPETALTSHR